MPKKDKKIFYQATKQEPWKATSPYKQTRKQSRERHRLRRPTLLTGSGEEVRSVKNHSGSYYWCEPRNEVQKETENSKVDRQTGCTTFFMWTSTQKMAESKEVAIHCDIGWNVFVYKWYNWKKGWLLRNKRETSAKRVQRERELRLATKHFVRNLSLPPKFNIIVDCSWKR